jgi:hypothetical protein
MANHMTRQQEVLAHLGGALLSAQIVERYWILMLEPSPARSNESGLDMFVSKSKVDRLVHLKKMLKDLREREWSVPKIDAELRRFLKDRNKLVHRFQDLGSWNFRRADDCDGCVTFLRAFIDRATSLQHLFVSAISVRDVQLGTRVSKVEADRYAKACRRFYAPLEIRWTERICT